jgi:glycosyltransferase involved in cell wall biosynthesis
MATGFLMRTRAARDLGIHLIDTADRRGLGNVGRLDLGNILLAILHGARFWWALASVRPRVVYVPIAQNTLGFLRDSLFLIPSRLTRRRIVIHVHGGHFGDFYSEASAAMRWLVRYCLSRSEAVVVLGRCLSEMLDGVVPAERVHVVPNGIDVPITESSSLDTGRVLWLSKMDVTKGYLDVLKAAPRVLEVVPDANFVFAGEWLSPADEAEALEFVVSARVADRVKFVGPVAGDAKDELLATASVFTLPTRYRYEGQPYAILEAMSHGVPVVTSPAGCIVETVLDGQTGIMVPAGDVTHISEALILLLSNEDDRRRLGEAARLRFMEQYTAARWDERMSRILESAAMRPK